MSNLKNLKALRSGDTIVLHYNGDTLNIQKSSRPAAYKQVEKFLEANNIDALIEAFLDIKASIEKYTKDKITIDAGALIDKQTGQAIPPAIAKKLLLMKSKTADFLPLWRFWQKLKKNPSKNSVEQLYTFIEKNNVPITELGDLVLEKGVHMKPDGSLWDDYTKNTFDNSIGMVVQMPREKVVDNPNETCSRGLHVAAPAYVRQTYSNSVIIEVIVDPADVVSVPIDYNATKMRVCRYQVMGLAKHSSIDKLVVKMDDFVELPEVEERRTNRYNEIPMNTQTDLMKLTAKKIISYVRKQTGKRITIDPKNKSSIAKRAAEILQAAGKTDLPHSQKTGAVNEIVFTDKNCNSIIELVGTVIGQQEAKKLAGNDPRRGRFIAKVTPILKAKGFTVVD